MNALGWLLIPLGPLAALLAVLIVRDRVMPWLWLACLPALVAAVWPPEALDLSWLWPGAVWHAADQVTRGILGFTALLWAAASIYGITTQQTHPRRLRFWVFWLLTLCGNLLLIVAQDGASYYVGFTLMSLSAYALVVHQGGPKPRQAGRVYLQLAILGELLIYAALMMRIHEAGNVLAFADWQTTPVGGLTAVLLVVGFGLKAGFWPLHVWLPLAHPAAPAAASAVLSGAMIKAGILGIWRFLPEADPMLQSVSGWVVALGLFSAFYGVIVGLAQTQAKSALAYSTVSQVGYLLAILALSWHAPEHAALWATVLVLYVVHHGFAKGALFLGAGMGKAHHLKLWHWLLLFIPALALAGLPLTTGGAVKTLLKDAFEVTDFAGWLPILTLGSMATTLLVLRSLWLIFKAQPDAHKAPAPPPTLFYSWAVLCLMPVLVPLVWPTMREAWLDSLSLYASWALLWPLLIAGAVALAGGLMVRRIGLPAGMMQRLNAQASPARWLSLKLKRHVQTQIPAQVMSTSGRSRARRLERQWNRFWQRDIVVMSAWFVAILVVLLLGLGL